MNPRNCAPRNGARGRVRMPEILREFAYAELEITGHRVAHVAVSAFTLYPYRQTKTTQITGSYICGGRLSTANMASLIASPSCGCAWLERAISSDEAPNSIPTTTS